MDGGVVMTGGGAWRRDQIRHVKEYLGGRGYEYMLCYRAYAGVPQHGG